jgi:Tol biopolymer transport system component
MSEYRSLIEREMDRVRPRPFTLDSFLRRRNRRLRNQRIGVAAMALVVAIAGVGGAIWALRSRDRSIPARPIPSPLPSNGGITFFRLEGVGGNLYVIDPSGGTTRRLDTCRGDCRGMGIASADWSPDGTRIAYSVFDVSRLDIGDRAGIYVLDLRTGVSTQLTRCVAPCVRQGSLGGGLDWSPDGTRIAFDEAVNGTCHWAMDFLGSCRIFIVNADGSGRVRLPTGPVTNALGPSWSPDGTRIAFSGRVGPEWFVYTMGIDGSDLERLSGVRPSTDANEPAWSPAGTELLLKVVDPPKEFPGCEVLVAAVDGSQARVIADGCEVGGPAVWGDGPTWSPDGTMIAFYDGNGLEVIRPDGTGRAHVATEGMKGGRPTGTVAWQPVPPKA